MQRNSFKLYLILFFLLFVLVGCYTLLSNPTKIESMHKQDNHSVEKQDKIDEPHSVVSRDYVRRAHDPYVYGHNGYYGIVPRYYNRYTPHDHYNIYDIPRPPVSQAPSQQRAEIKVEDAPPAVDVKQRNKVWKKRNSRVKQTPKPTRRQQDDKQS